MARKKIDQEWSTFSDARKREEVRHRGERVMMTTMAGVQWLTLTVVLFLTLAAFSIPTTPGQQALISVRFWHLSHLGRRSSRRYDPGWSRLPEVVEEVVDRRNRPYPIAKPGPSLSS